jgi:hypothetical protein
MVRRCRSGMRLDQPIPPFDPTPVTVTKPRRAPSVTYSVTRGSDISLEFPRTANIAVRVDGRCWVAVPPGPNAGLVAVQPHPENRRPRGFGGAIPCSAVAQRRQKIIHNRLALVGEESVSGVTRGNGRGSKPGEPTHAHLHHWQ